jgi:hypothetical protein
VRQYWWTQEGKELHCVVQCNTCMKGVDTGDQFLSSEENCEVVKEAGGVSDKLDTPQCILCVQDPEQKQENKI